MKKILFILLALIVCFVALPEIVKAIRRIMFEESLRAIWQNTEDQTVLDEVARQPHSGMTVAEVKILRRKRSILAK